MALYKYFKPCRKVTFNMPFPDPEGPLSEEMDTETVKELSKDVVALINSSTMGKRSPYLKVTVEQKTTIGKYAAEHSIINVMRHFVAKFPKGALNKSTVCGWKKAYLAEVQSQQWAGKDLSIMKLPTKKVGRPLVLVETLEKELQGLFDGCGQSRWSC